jgi:hypothetical protein
MKKVTSRWVPHELIDKQKHERVKLCRENLAKFHAGSWRLCDIITGDEVWVYHRQIGHKSTNKSWVGEGESPRTSVQTDVSRLRMASVEAQETVLPT